MWKNNYNWYDTWACKPHQDGEILIENENINKFKRDQILQRFNFASPYVELPKKLTVRQNLEIYGRLYGVKDLNKRIMKFQVI